MQLNEILEENSVQTISKKTNITEENLENLFAGKFDMLKKAKALGFISIVEREFGADLTSLKKEALAFYGENVEDDGMVLDTPMVSQSSKGKSKILIMAVLLLLGVASWYFVTRFDQEKLRELLPFNEEKVVSSQEKIDDIVSNSDSDIAKTVISSEETSNSGDVSAAEETMQEKPNETETAE